MSSTEGVLLAVIVAALIGTVAGLVVGILVWVRNSTLKVSERAAEAILRAGAAGGATILLVVAIFAAIGMLR
jgi:hypothetical protein